MLNFMATDLPGKTAYEPILHVAIGKVTHSRTCYHSIHDDDKKRVKKKGKVRRVNLSYTYVAQHLRR
jgi:hypothetical protein